MLREPRFQEDRLALAKEQALQEMKKRNDDAADIERARVERAALRREALHQPLHHRGLGQGDHARRPGAPSTGSTSIPANMVAGGRRARSRGPTMLREAGGRLRRLAEHRARRCRPPPGGDRHRRARASTASRRTCNQGRVSHRPARGEARQPRRLRARGDERDPGRQRVHLAHHARPSARTRGSPTRRAPACASACTTRAPSAPSSSPRAAPCPTRRSWCWRRSRRSASSRSPRRSWTRSSDNLIETFPSNFASKAQAMAHLRRRTSTRGRDPAYWQTYRDRIRAVTAADVQRVARDAPGAGEDGRPGGGRPEGDRRSATASTR